MESAAELAHNFREVSMDILIIRILNHDNNVRAWLGTSIYFLE